MMTTPKGRTLEDLGGEAEDVVDEQDDLLGYTQLAGLKTYTIGPEDSKKVILFVYDIFGFSPQTGEHVRGGIAAHEEIGENDSVALRGEEVGT
jgi:hypothetical protein